MTGTNEMSVAELIIAECNALRDMLIEKNRKYGNSAIEPMRIASRASAEEQILVRIDDKLSRLKSMQPDETEDVWRDLLGYIVLLMVCRKLAKQQLQQPPQLLGRLVRSTGTELGSTAGQIGLIESVSDGGRRFVVRWRDPEDVSVFYSDEFAQACELLP